MARGKKSRKSPSDFAVSTAKVAPGNLTGVVAGGPGKSVPAKPIAGPVSAGGPASMRKALGPKPKTKSTMGV